MRAVLWDGKTQLPELHKLANENARLRKMIGEREQQILILKESLNHFERIFLIIYLLPGSNIYTDENFSVVNTLPFAIFRQGN